MANVTKIKQEKGGDGMEGTSEVNTKGWRASRQG